MLSRTELKTAYFRLLRLARADARLLRQIRSDSLLVLNLHRVSPEANSFWPPLAPAYFDDLLAFVRQHFHVTIFRELAVTPKDRPAIILSFDDGYLDFVEYAMPLLEKHGCRANLNIIPECVISGRAPWNVELYDFLNSAPRMLIHEIRLPGFEHRLAADDADSKQRFGTALSHFLKMRSRAEREPLLAQLAPILSRHDFPRTRMTSADHVRQAAQRHEIGVHSFAHDSMAFETASFFLQDLQRCQNLFRDDLRLPLSIYAFPNGSYRSEQVEILRQNRIEHVLLVDERISVRRASVHPRLTVGGSSATETRFRALGYGAGARA